MGLYYMKITFSRILISDGSFIKSQEWNINFSYLCDLIKKMEHPIGSGKFYIFPQSGKKRGEGNGVKPIKEILMNKLDNSWTREVSFNTQLGFKIGKVDAVCNINNYKLA